MSLIIVDIVNIPTRAPARAHAYTQ